MATTTFQLLVLQIFRSHIVYYVPGLKVAMTASMTFHMVALEKRVGKNKMALLDNHHQKQMMQVNCNESQRNFED